MQFILYVVAGACIIGVSLLLLKWDREEKYIKGADKTMDNIPEYWQQRTTPREFMGRAVKARITRILCILGMLCLIIACSYLFFILAEVQ